MSKEKTDQKKTNPKRDFGGVAALFGAPESETANESTQTLKSGEKALDAPKTDQLPAKVEAKTAVAPKPVKKAVAPKPNATPQPATESSTASDERKKDYVMTYFSPENYDSFVEMFDETKNAVRKRSGQKMKATNVAEMAIMIAYDSFTSDKEGFFEKVLEKLETKS